MSPLLVKLLSAALALSLVVDAAPHRNNAKGRHGGKKGKAGKGGAAGAAAQAQAATGQAIYFLTNDAQNAVVALPIGADGTLSAGSVTATGGSGSNSIDGSTNTTAAPDALVGQSSLTIAGQVSLFPSEQCNAVMFVC